MPAPVLTETHRPRLRSRHQPRRPVALLPRPRRV